MSGSRTYFLPSSDVEVTVDYTYSKSDGASFEAAYIGGESLDTDSLYVKDDKGNYSTLTSVFQDQLNDDESDIADDDADSIAEARADERAGR